MFDDKQNKELIETAVQNLEATEMELALAERLQAAIDELDRMTLMLRQLEVPRGADS